MKEQARESESDRRKLERARQEVFHHMTIIKNEKENLEREVNINIYLLDNKKIKIAIFCRMIN